VSWAGLPLETDPDAVTKRLLTALFQRLNPESDAAGWVPREGAPEVAIVEEIGRELAATNVRTREAADVAAAGFGVSVYGFAPITSAPATLPTRLALTVPGGTVPGGLTVVGRTQDGIDVAFRLRETVTAEAAASTLDVLLVATSAGAVGNGVPAGPVAIITTTAAVDTATATGPSTDGVDAETRDAYLGRLVDFIAVLRPGGVRASDLTVLARSVPGVARALAIDLYDADTGQANVERTVSVYPVDEDGQPVGPATAAALRDRLEEVREVNFRLRLGTPTYTAVHVTVTAVAEEGASPAAVAAAVKAAVLAFLDPASWGASSTDPGAWTATSLVRYLPLTRAAGSVPGLFYLTAVTINGGTVDVPLPGVAALPATPAGGTTVDVTVTGG
jgi:hypothetical protein